MSCLIDHYEVLPKLRIDALQDSNAVLDLISLDAIEPGLRLVLDQAPWFGTEGPLVLNLFRAEERIYSLAFGLQSDGDEVTAHVGAIQGRALPDVVDVYRELTKAAHGLRPRGLLLELFKTFCAAAELHRIVLVSDKHRQHRDPFFGSVADALMTNYDAIWTEHGAWRLDEGAFEMSLAPNRRCPGAIPSRKRSLYRRRYKLLDELQAELTARVHALQHEKRVQQPGHALC